MLVLLLMLMAAQMPQLVRPVVSSVMPKTSVTPRYITRSLVGRCLVGDVGRRAGLATCDQVVAGAGGPRLRQRRVADHGHRHGPCRLRRRRPGRAGPDAEELPAAATVAQC